MNLKTIQREATRQGVKVWEETRNGKRIYCMFDNILCSDGGTFAYVETEHKDSIYNYLMDRRKEFA